MLLSQTRTIFYNFSSVSDAPGWSTPALRLSRPGASPRHDGQPRPGQDAQAKRRCYELIRDRYLQTVRFHDWI